MRAPPLLRERGRAVQIVLAGVLPLIFGAVCGVLLGTSEIAYDVVTTAGALGGVNAGFEHDTPRGGFWRGISGGALFALALVATHAARGVPARAELPAALPIMAVFYAVMGVPFGLLGAWLRARRSKIRTAPAR